MKKTFLLFAVLVSSFGLAQSRLTVADYVLAMPSGMHRIAEDTPSRIRAWIGDTKKSETRINDCAKVTKDIKNDYMDLEYGGCSAGSGDANSHSYGVWRTPNSQMILIGSVFYYGWGGGTDHFGVQLQMVRTSNGKTFTDVSNQVLPISDLKKITAKCKIGMANLGFTIPRKGTSIRMRSFLNSSFEYSLDWNNKTQKFTLSKGKC